MLQLKSISTSLVTLLNDKTLIRRALKGQKLFSEDKKNSTEEAEALLTNIYKINKVLPKIKMVMAAQDALTLSGKAFRLSKENIHTDAFAKDLKRAQDLKESENLNANHLHFLDLIIQELQPLTHLMHQLKMSYQTLDEMEKTLEKNKKELMKRLKKMTSPLYRAPL